MIVYSVSGENMLIDLYIVIGAVAIIYVISIVGILAMCHVANNADRHIEYKQPPEDEK